MRTLGLLILSVTISAIAFAQKVSIEFDEAQDFSD